MAQITRLPGGRNISLGMGTGSVGMPRTNADDFGAESWRNVQELGQQVTRASVVAMDHFIDEDHQRQEDEARLDLTHIGNERWKKVEELSQKRTSEAFNTPEEYLQYSQSQYDALQNFNSENEDVRRGGELYRRRIEAGIAEIDAMNVKRLQRHALDQRNRLHQESLDVANAGALERISRDPGRLQYELENVIYPNISAQVNAQGYGSAMVGEGESAVYMADFYKQQAETGALKTALSGMVAQNGATAALEMLRSSDMDGIRARIGEASWKQIFGAYEAKLQAQQIEEQKNLLEVQLNNEIATLRQNGEDDFTIQTAMVEKYGPSMGVSAVNSILRGVPGVDPKASSENIKAAGKAYFDSMMSGLVDWSTLEASARAADAQTGSGSSEHYAEFIRQRDNALTMKRKVNEYQNYRTEQILGGMDSPVAQNIRLGTAEGFQAAREGVAAMTGLTEGERAYLDDGITKAESAAQAGQETALQRRINAEKRQNDAQKAARLSELQSLAGTLMLRPGNPEQSEEFQRLNPAERKLVRTEFQAWEEGQYEGDPVRQLRNHAKWDKFSGIQLNSLGELEQRKMFWEVGGRDSPYGKELSKKMLEKRTGSGKFTSLMTDLNNRLRAATGTSPQGPLVGAEFTQVSAEAEAELARLQNDYLETHDMQEPPLAYREAMLSSVTQKAVAKRAGIIPTTGGTELDAVQMETEFPEVYARSIRTATRDAVRRRPMFTDALAMEQQGLPEFYGRRDVQMSADIEPTWELFEVNGQTELVQTGISFQGPNDTSPDPDTASAMSRIRQDVVRRFPNTAATLWFFPTGNALVAKDTFQNTLQIYDRAGNPLGGGQ